MSSKTTKSNTTKLLFVWLHQKYVRKSRLHNFDELQAKIITHKIQQITVGQLQTVFVNTNRKEDEWLNEERCHFKFVLIIIFIIIVHSGYFLI